jgi:hypothetical protein
VTPSRLLEELLLVAGRAGLPVQSKAFRGRVWGPGGLCTVGGRTVLFLDTRAPPLERSVALADALAVRDIDALEMPPEVRRFVLARTRTRSGIVAPEEILHPGLHKTEIDPDRK